MSNSAPGSAKPRPLAGVRIISVEQYGAGPFGSMYLADLGAEVIKIETPAKPGAPGGDVARATGPLFLAPQRNHLGESQAAEHANDVHPTDSQFFQTFNLNKRSLTLDLKAAEGRAVLHRLVRSADAVMNNLRGDQPAKLGLDYASLAAIKPSVVCAHLSAYGRDNERQAWPGYDYLMQAEAGFLALTGEPDGPPARFGLSMVDYMSGLTTALGLVASVLGARISGIGRDVDVALFDVALHQLSYPATWYLNDALTTTRLERSAHPATVPCQLFKTADGWVFVMAMLEKFWQQLLSGVARPELASDPRFASFATRREHRLALSALLDAALMTQSTAFWLEKFAGIIPIAPVYDLAQALNNPYVERIGMLQTIAHPSGALRVLANPIKLDGQRIAGAACPPAGQDSADILRTLGFSAAAVAELQKNAVI
jgi:crotonobetainyl-CoA:carnitine CoA-transferase CaiB-like acyl-CoA transferase